MRLKEAIDYIDKMKPNDFEAEEKTLWVNEVEGMIQTEVLLAPPSDIITYCYGDTLTAAGIYFPDEKTMVLPEPLNARKYGKLTVSGLLTYAGNNGVFAIESVSDDGMMLTFEYAPFTAVGTAGDTGEAMVAFDGSMAELIAPPPYDCLYYLYLGAMIDFYNAEYDRYANSFALFNSKYEAFRKWYTTHYRGRCCG